MKKCRIDPAHIQARLHPDTPPERQALEIYYEHLRAGQTPRQILTDALLSLEGQPIHVPENNITPELIRLALEGARELFAQVFGKLLDERLEELAAMTPAERHRHVDEVARSSFSNSILNAVDMTDYEDE